MRGGGGGGGGGGGAGEGQASCPRRTPTQISHPPTRPCSLPRQLSSRFRPLHLTWTFSTTPSAPPCTTPTPAGVSGGGGVGARAPRQQQQAHAEPPSPPPHTHMPGLDFVWPFLLRYPRDKIAVVDQASATSAEKGGHPRGVGRGSARAGGRGSPNPPPIHPPTRHCRPAGLRLAPPLRGGQGRGRARRGGALHSQGGGEPEVCRARCAHAESPLSFPAHARERDATASPTLSNNPHPPIRIL